ncbi:hypothetical protein BH24PSE2_BH24PSE2_11920 [soil metagenome]
MKATFIFLVLLAGSVPMRNELAAATSVELESPRAADAIFARPIHLRSRTYTPLLSDSLVGIQTTEALQNSELDRLHLLVQFTQMPSENILDELNAIIVNFVPEDTVVLSIPAGMNLNDLPHVRWIGSLRWEDKIDDSAAAVFCRSPQFASTEHAHPSMEKPYLIYAFYDVPSGDLESIIQNAGGMVDPNPFLAAHTRLTWGFPDVIRKIAADSRVAWIEAADETLVQKDPVTYCAGIITDAGPVADFATIMRSTVTIEVPQQTASSELSVEETKAGEPATEESDTFGSQGWDGPGLKATSLQYRVGITPSGLNPANKIESALDTWSKYVQVSFTKAPQAKMNRSIDFNWYAVDSTTHPGANPDYEFGRYAGGLPAPGHGFPPPDATELNVKEPLAGDVHFNSDVPWHTTGSNRFNVFTEALHEIGHSLGLEHSTNAKDVMKAFHEAYFADLTPNDIARIRTIYKSTEVISPAGPSASASVNPCGCYGGAHISWTVAARASTYELYSSPKNNPAQKTSLYRGSRTGYHVEIPPPGPLSIWVRACNTAGCSSYTKGNRDATYSRGCF